MTLPVNVAVFASGGGTNLQALLDHEDRQRGSCAYHVALVISDRENAGALNRARVAGREVSVVSFSDREPVDVGSEILTALVRSDVKAVLLAGFLRLVPAEVTAAFSGRMINIHPALLPAFGGKGMYGSRVHEAVLESGVSISGPTVHFVDLNYDTGAIIAQWPVPVHAGDNPDDLADRVLAAEHVLYPAVADQLAAAIHAGGDMPPFRPDATAFVSGGWDAQRVSTAIRAGFRRK